MKKIIIPAIFAAIVSFIACEKQPLASIENIEKEQALDSYVYTINAVAPDTKSDYDGSGTFSWSVGDAISVLFHNGATNKFFTLTTTGSGSSATFSGVIEDGYVIGASDGTASDKKIWALYPASANHAYTEGSNPSFHIAAETDFTASHFSANMPMYDLLTEEGNLSFKHLAVGYKFIVSNIDDSVTKIRFTVTNQLSYALSGKISMSGSSSKYLSYGSLTDASQTISFVSSVVDHSAVFYVSTRYSQTYFRPTITITDYNTGNVIKELEATKTPAAITTKGKVQPITISAPGTGTPWSFTSPNSIDWSSVTASANGRSDNPYDGIKVIKGKMDATYLYLYFEVDESALYDNADYKYANYSFLYLGDSDSATAFDWQWTSMYTTKISSWIKYNNNLAFMNWNANISSYIEEHNDVAYYEVKITRSAFSCLSGSSALVSLEINKQYVQIVEEQEKWLGSSTQVGFAPTTGVAALTVTAD